MFGMNNSMLILEMTISVITRDLNYWWKCTKLVVQHDDDFMVANLEGNLVTRMNSVIQLVCTMRLYGIVGTKGAIRKYKPSTG